MLVRQIFDPKLAQYAYLIGCPATGECAIVDPERDVDQYFELAENVGLRLVAAVDTHIHADYLSGMRELAERGVKVYASDEGDADWKYEWLIGSSYDHKLLKNGDSFMVGNILFESIQKAGTTDGQKVAEAIRGMEHQTVFGAFSFDEKGDVTRSIYTIWTVQDGKYILWKDARK